MTAELETQLSKKFRAHRSAIEAVLAGTGGDDFAAAEVLLATRCQQSRPVMAALAACRASAQLTCAWDALLMAMVRASINRILSRAAPEHELVLFDLLRRAYRAQWGRRQVDGVPDPRRAPGRPRD